MELVDGRWWMAQCTMLEMPLKAVMSLLLAKLMRLVASFKMSTIRSRSPCSIGFAEVLTTFVKISATTRPLGVLAAAFCAHSARRTHLNRYLAEFIQCTRVEEGTISTPKDSALKNLKASEPQIPDQILTLNKWRCALSGQSFFGFWKRKHRAWQE
jgi:hypothetical protein